MTPLTPYQGDTTRRRSNMFTPLLVNSTTVIIVPTPETSTGALPKISNQTLITPRPMDITNNMSVASLTKKISQTNLSDQSDSIAVASKSKPIRRFQYNKTESSRLEKSKESDNETVLEPQLMQLTARKENIRRSLDIISMQVNLMNEKITQKINPWLAKKVVDSGAKMGGEQIVVEAIVHREDPHSQKISTQVIIFN